MFVRAKHVPQYSSAPIGLRRVHKVALPEGIDPATDLQVRSPVCTLVEYFKPWVTLKRLPVGKQCLDEMMRASLAALAADNVTYVELRNSPFNIAEINGTSLDESIVWLAEAAHASSQETGVTARLVLGLSRRACDLQAAERLLSAVRRVASPLIVGLDISGDEDQPIDAEISRVFRVAKEDLGLGVSIHAGETGSKENIRWAVEDCRADRIGHGLAATSSTELLDLLTRHDVCVEVCLFSNWLSGRVKSVADHPVTAFIRHGVPFVLCSDNPAVHGRSLSDEYELFASAFKRADLLPGMYKVQQRYAFDGFGI